MAYAQIPFMGTSGTYGSASGPVPMPLPGCTRVHELREMAARGHLRVLESTAMKRDLTEGMTLAARDWRRVHEFKQARWIERKRRLGPAEGIRVAAELRAQMVARKPDWPSPESRRADLETHVRVGKMLRACRRPG